ncbi:MAG: tail fiber domain-containing protein [Burkholderiales bacterium]
MRKTILFAAAVLLLAITQPARAQFCPGVSPWVFDDVAASDPFCGYITWMAENGITLGCQTIDANHRLYCPNATVTRAAMAAFMNRLGNVRVEAVDTGPGLTGGPITSVGTINLAATQLLPTTACTSNQIPRWNGSAWSCSNDANSGGTVTSVASGTGLTGGPVTTTGTLSIAAGYQLPQSCTNGQVPKSTGAGGWTCAADANSGGTVTSVTAGAGLTGGTITTSGTIAVDPASTTLTGNFFKQGGNAFGATAVLGTTDNNAVEVRANGARVVRYEPNAISPNVIGGSPANSISAGVRGATIGGGGVPTGDTDPDFLSEAPNRVTDAYGTVGGGYANRAGDDAGTTLDRPFATVGGGFHNAASGSYATVGGGNVNTASGAGATVGGGSVNTASGNAATVGGGDGNTASGGWATVGGGSSNLASGPVATVGGGYENTASGVYASVGGGDGNTASGYAATVAGGLYNNAAGDYSVALGYHAITTAAATGSFVFADASANTDYGSGNPGEFIVSATGGILMLTARDYTTGCRIPKGAGTWTCSSSREMKRDFLEVDAGEILARVVALPLTTWQYKAESGVRHLGPMAQDFHTAFGLGPDDQSIAMADASGVALAAIQGLNAKLEAAIATRDATIEAQAREIADLKRAVEVLMSRASPEGRLAAR